MIKNEVYELIAHIIGGNQMVGIISNTVVWNFGSSKCRFLTLIKVHVVALTYIIYTEGGF